MGKRGSDILANFGLPGESRNAFHPAQYATKLRYFAGDLHPIHDAARGLIPARNFAIESEKYQDAAAERLQKSHAGEAKAGPCLGYFRLVLAQA